MSTCAASAPATLSAADRAESARYALLRRLAPSMRHHLVVNLQPIGMIYEVMDRRLRAPQPDLAHVQASAQKMNGFARAALDSCLDVVTWLAPEDGALTGASEGVRECLSLLSPSLGFRGYAVRHDVGAVTGQVRHAAVRSVLTAAVLHLTDEHPAPAEVTLRAEPAAAGLEVTLQVRPVAGEPGMEPHPSYRKLEWRDVQALGATEGVELRRAGGGLVLSFPWVRPARA
ncbi:MAG TPA: hypothetical protein VEA40_27800 [Ramlibacter sp.]|nr:hypothetical protein [Ramlibacter sp.]